MTAEPLPDRPDRRRAASTGDIVISIDAMGGDRGRRRRHPRHGHVAREEPAPALHPARRRRPAGALDPHKGSPLAERTEIRHAAGVIAMDEKPSKAVRSAQGTSMWNALEAVKVGESPVVISCGNTGALMALAMLALRKAPGVDRPAIAVLWPSSNPPATTCCSTAAPTSAPTPTTC